MVDRFASMLDCVDVGFLPDGVLDQLPLSWQIGGTRVGGIQPEPAPHARGPRRGTRLGRGTRWVHRRRAHRQRAIPLTGQTAADYPMRQAADDLRKLRGKHLVVKPERTCR